MLLKKIYLNYLLFFHVTKCVISIDHLPTCSCLRSYWMTPFKNSAYKLKAYKVCRIIPAALLAENWISFFHKFLHDIDIYHCSFFPLKSIKSRKLFSEKGAAKKILEKIGIQNSSSFVKNDRSVFLILKPISNFFLGLYGLVFI